MIILFVLVGLNGAMLILVATGLYYFMSSRKNRDMAPSSRYIVPQISPGSYTYSNFSTPTHSGCVIWAFIPFICTYCDFIGLPSTRRSGGFMVLSPSKRNKSLRLFRRTPVLSAFILPLPVASNFLCHKPNLGGPLHVQGSQSSIIRVSIYQSRF